MTPTPEQFLLWVSGNYPSLYTVAPLIYRKAIAASPLPELLDSAKQAREALAMAIELLQEESFGYYSRQQDALEALNAALAKVEGR